jgi:outer membrane receptor for ferrienterochelin and colicin
MLNQNLLLTSFILFLFGSNSLFAQQSGTLEEIVVTANKRGAQSLQDIAGSVQAISSQTLERTLAEGFEDYIKMVPGLTSVSSGTGQSQIVIRGVNSNRVIHTSTQTRSLAGLYLDEMPISLAGFNPDLGVVEVERIEVLRGPQGTLYGSSSMSGTIRIITKKPDTEEVSGSIGADTSFT